MCPIISAFAKASDFASAFAKATADKCATPDKTADRLAVDYLELVMGAATLRKSGHIRYFTP